MDFRKLVSYALIGAAALAAVGIGYIAFAALTLPSFEALKRYEPPVTTRVHASDGDLITEFAEEHRVFVPYQELPPRLVDAFVSAEDQHFFEHMGVDPSGLLRASLVNIKNVLIGKRMQGASTITQQVAKNMLLSSERSIGRKIKEALTALRIEQTFSKQKILELYLNEIYLGQRAYGVGAAALTYFDKPLDELTLADCAYLAALPKGPNNYNPATRKQRAIERRNWVLSRMADDGYISEADMQRSQAEPLNAQIATDALRNIAAEYFVEELRQSLVKQLGEKKLYNGGLSVRSTLDTRLQTAARNALRNGLEGYDRRRGWRGAIATIAIDDDWANSLKTVKIAADIGDWRPAVILSTNQAGGVQLGFTDGSRGSMSAAEASWAIKGKSKLGRGQVIYVQKKADKSYAVKQIPQVNGALVALDPRTGRVLAMVGGYSFEQSKFNRATQAYRQPGSSFKPIAYAAALDHGYTPASLILDAPFVAPAGEPGEFYAPLNYSKEFYGLSTMRLGLEKSRNVMTVRLAQDMGMGPIVEYGKNFGVSDKLEPVLSTSLGAGETTVLRITSAYAVFVNGGKKVTPTLLDRVQDRFGRTVYPTKKPECPGCRAQWNGQAAPEIPDRRAPVIDEVTAYQMTSMLQGVVERGTGASLKSLGRPLAGKTGTTNDYKDAWFIGFSPDLVAGVWVGYDQPKSLGEGESGGSLSVPIFGEFIGKALANQPAAPFRTPPGVSFVTIDARTGGLPSAATAQTLVEAFRPGTEPTRSISNDVFSYGGANTQPESIPANGQKPATVQSDLDDLY